MYEQDRLVVRLQQRALAEAALAACWLGGSFGRKSADAFSDIDVCLVYADDDARAAAWRARRDFAQSVLAYVPAKSFDADHIRPYFHIALYSNGAKADFRFESQTSLAANPWDADIHILKDTAGWAAAFQAACARLATPQPRLSSDELATLDNRFWVMWWDVYRQVQRGAPAKPFPEYLRLLASTLPPLLAALPPQDPAYAPLIAAHYSLDAVLTQEHLRRLLQAYQAARAAVIRRQQLAFTPSEAFERQIGRLITR